MFIKAKRFFSSTRFKTTIWYSSIFLILEIALGLLIYFYLYNTLLDNLDTGLKSQANAIMRVVSEKHINIEHFVPDSTYSAPEDLVWDLIYNEVAFNLRNNFIQIQYKKKVIFKSANLGDYTFSFPDKKAKFSLFSFTDSSLSKKPIRCVQVINKRYKIIEAFPIQHISQTLNSLVHIFIILAPIFFLISILGGALISAKSLSRIDAIIKKTEEITAQNLDEKIGGEEYSDEYGRLVKKMNEMIERIKTSVDYMNQFSISAAHELKTPLTILRGEVEVALKSPKTKEAYLEVLKSNYEEIIRLSKIIDNLFFISKIDHSLLEIKKEKTNLDEFLKTVVNSLKILGSEKNIELILKSNSHAQVEVDKSLMTQALFNLIENAIKYGEENESVIISAENLNSGQVKIKVSNTGEGIPADSIEQIFDRFYRVETSRNRNTGGAGLGLSVVKAIINWHEAEISAHSEQNKVTEFSITLTKA